ncbi:MAG: DsbA family oxidoreductase [Alphaproteobacteria bacterium]|nr:DsbA family oxidoreductase [Alphaproteobacteria bacterium]
MRIDVIFDTICPWCYVGKRRLERALAQRPLVRPEIRWRPFLLNPDMPASGIERKAYLESKFGGPYRVKQMYSAVAAAGAGEGIPFSFETIVRTPDSLPSHRLIRLAGRMGKAGEAVEAVFFAYFAQGIDISDFKQLQDIGLGLGLDDDLIIQALEDAEDSSQIVAENARAHRLGINGVPSYVFNEAYALAGAQESDIFLRLIDLARETETQAPVS